MHAIDYHKTVTAKITLEEAFQNITNIAKWWTSHFEGNAVHLDDTFKTTFGDNWFTYRVMESIPGKTARLVGNRLLHTLAPGQKRMERY